ncbi:MAG TPA: hypothetical protein ENH85_11295 [Candidatus Scalindua sp.]|nr:hypothetical protein [Candidatus Scalindua sp.]
MKCTKDNKEMRRTESSITYKNPQSPDIYICDCGEMIYEYPPQHAWETKGITVVNPGCASDTN